jgi:glutaminyl-peptide cyclotransferase
MHRRPTIYQSPVRHLAEKWSSSYIAPHSKRRFLRDPAPTELSTIEHLVLLDLLGASRPSIQSYFPETGWLFDELLSAETKLGEEGHLTGPGSAADRYHSFFKKRTGQESVYGYIGDDHLPFLSRGVSILHVISSPFPRVWHTLSVGEDIAASSDCR